MMGRLPNVTLTCGARRVRLSALPSFLALRQADNSNVSGSTVNQRESSLTGRRVILVGRLASMSRRDAERLIREGGGRLVDQASDEVDLIVASDATADAKRLAADRNLFT